MTTVDVSTLTPTEASSMCRFCMQPMAANQWRYTLDWPHDGPLGANGKLAELLERIIDQQLPISPHLPAQFCSACHGWLTLVKDRCQRFAKTAQMWNRYLEVHRNNSVQHEISMDELKHETDETAFEDTSRIEYLEIAICSDLDEMPDEIKETVCDQQTVENHVVVVEKNVAIDLVDRTEDDDDRWNRGVAPIPSHFNNTYYGPVAIECDLCGASFHRKTSLIKHMSDNHDLHRQYSCESCPKVFQSKEASRCHAKQHPPQKMYRCCGIAFYTTQSYRQHKRIHTTPVHCPTCNKAFHSVMRLRLHMEQHGEKKFGCDQCGQCFAVQRYLSRHKKKVHDLKANVECEKCGLLLYNYNLLMVHQSRNCTETQNTMPPKFVLRSNLWCTVVGCEYTCLRPETLRRHFTNVHADADWKGLAQCLCLRCLRQFDTPELVEAHRLKHHCFHCEICKTALISQPSLERHMKIHNADKERPFRCPICQGTYRSKYQLKSHHRRRHTNERPHPCPNCDKRYAEKYELKAHIQSVHSDDRFHLCPECQRTFVTAKYLAQHIARSHTGKFVYFKCPICNWNCPNSQALEGHMSVKHPVSD